MARFGTALFSAFALATRGVCGAITLDIDDSVSVNSAAALVAQDLLSFYKGDEAGEVPGILPGPPPDGDYYWWNGGFVWGSLLSYRRGTGNTTHDATITKALLWQVGPDDDYMPPNWTASMGNDDQAMWAMPALLAAEMGYATEPDEPPWLTLAENVFTEQTHPGRRVDEGGCKGLLRWQIFQFNNGYDYVDSGSNAAYFNLGARLAKLTGNDTYAELAGATYDQLWNLGYISDDYDVYDGASVPDCDRINKHQFSYNAGMLLQGVAYMYNQTGNETWKDRLDKLTDRTLEVFFPDGVAVERTCESAETCNTDMTFLKGLLLRGMSSAMQQAPHIKDKVLPVLKSTAKAAVAKCIGGENKRMCGFSWANGTSHGTTGAGPQMSVLDALSSIMEPQAAVSSGNGTSTTDGNTPSSTGDSSPSGTSTGKSAGARTEIGVSAVILLLASLAHAL